MKKYLSVTILLLFAVAAFGAEAEAPGGEGVPKVVFYQLMNFGAFFIIMFFLLRKKISEHFHGRDEAFRQALLKAEHARTHAEKQKKEIQARILELEQSSDRSVEQARTEAEAIRRRIVAEAEELSRRLKEDAHQTAEFEMQRARSELREDLLNQSVLIAKKILSENMNEPDQKRLQTEFVEKIQMVRS